MCFLHALSYHKTNHLDLNSQCKSSGLWENNPPYTIIFLPISRKTCTFQGVSASHIYFITVCIYSSASSCLICNTGDFIFGRCFCFLSDTYQSNTQRQVQWIELNRPLTTQDHLPFLQYTIQQFTSNVSVSFGVSEYPEASKSGGMK